jgi:hypothetical protein
MKTETTGAVMLLNKKEQKELCNESKETDCVDSTPENNQRSFGILDMWFLQKRKRTSTSMLRRHQ